MKYTDKYGDTWEATDDEGRYLLCTASNVSGFEGSAFTREHVESNYGPLRPVDGEEPQDGASDALPRVTDVMERATVFQTAHSLVAGLEWGEKASVYDVLNVAKWLEGEG